MDSIASATSVSSTFIACCRLDIGVVQRPLHQFEVAGLAQELGSEVVTEVMETESGNAGFRVSIMKVLPSKIQLGREPINL
jgi:hypothetical protein